LKFNEEKAIFRSSDNLKRIYQMTTYISILRGVNVSGYNVIKMNEFYKLYSDLGYSNIKTYIQSGNIIFQTVNTLPTYLEKIISEKIKEMFGLNINVFVFETDEYKRIIDNNPFISEQTKDIACQYISFLSSEPLAENLEKIRQKLSTNEELIIHGKTLYLYYPNGYSNSKINNNIIETKLNVISSTRNWRTCIKLLEIVEKLKEDK
jgi:uncharacterized protein (DUF1697 family)